MRVASDVPSAYAKPRVVRFDRKPQLVTIRLRRAAVRVRGDWPWLLAVIALTALGVALWLRVVEAKAYLYADLQHFFQFAEIAFTRDHADYYASVADQRYTYAHLPFFPMLLAPFYRVYTAFGWDPVLAVKTIVHAFDVGTAILLVALARRNGLGRTLALAVGIAWLFAPWVFESGALNGHAGAVAAFFFVASVLRRHVPWQAGALLALAVCTRTEFIIAALAFGGVYARSTWRALGGYAAGAAVPVALIVGPYVVRDWQALHWGVVGHLQGRGDGLPALRAIVQTVTGGFPDALAGPQDWAMPVAMAMAVAIGLMDRDHARASFKASMIYALALTLGHGRYFIFPLAAAMTYGARPGLWVPIGAWYVVEFFIPMSIDGRWIVRTMAIGLVLVWPLTRKIRGEPESRPAAEPA